MTNNLGKMHDAFAKHNSSVGNTAGVKTMLSDSLMPGKPQTPAQHNSVVKAAKASAAKRTINSGLPSPPAMPGMAPAKFGTKKVF